MVADRMVWDRRLQSKPRMRGAWGTDRGADVWQHDMFEQQGGVKEEEEGDDRVYRQDNNNTNLDDIVINDRRKVKGE
jgi:hypothetical protein